MKWVKEGHPRAAGQRASRSKGRALCLALLALCAQAALEDTLDAGSVFVLPLTKSLHVCPDAAAKRKPMQKNDQVRTHQFLPACLVTHLSAPFLFFLSPSLLPSLSHSLSLSLSLSRSRSMKMDFWTFPCNGFCLPFPTLTPLPPFLFFLALFLFSRESIPLLSLFLKFSL